VAYKAGNVVENAPPFLTPLIYLDVYPATRDDCEVPSPRHQVGEEL